MMLDIFVMVMALICIARTLPEWWRTIGDVRYQWRER